MLHIATYILAGLGATLVVTFASFFIGATAGIPLVFATRSRVWMLRLTVRVFVDLVRSVPPLVWLFLVYFGLTQVGLRLTSMIAAVVTLGFIASSYLAEIYRGGLVGIGRGQWEASEATGLSRIDAARFVIVPQMLRLVGPAMATYLIGLLKDSALASTIGVFELTSRASAQAQHTGKGLLAFTIVGVIYLLLSLPLAFASRHVDSRIRAKFSVA